LWSTTWQSPEADSGRGDSHWRRGGYQRCSHCGTRSESTDRKGNRGSVLSSTSIRLEGQNIWARTSVDVESVHLCRRPVDPFSIGGGDHSLLGKTFRRRCSVNKRPWPRGPAKTVNGTLLDRATCAADPANNPDQIASRTIFRIQPTTPPANHDPAVLCGAAPRVNKPRAPAVLDPSLASLS